MSQNEKYAYRYQSMTSHHGLTKRVAAPIATSEFEIRYGLNHTGSGEVSFKSKLLTTDDA